MEKKIIYLLIGSKGSGKSFIGSLIEAEFGIKFVRVEDWAKTIKKERSPDDNSYLKDVFNFIEKGIRKEMLTSDKLVFESTGLTSYFDKMLENLNQDFHLVTIAVKAKSETCLSRVKSRDQSIHINVSDEQVMMINQKVQERNFQTDFTVENELKNRREILDELNEIIERKE